MAQKELYGYLMLTIDLGFLEKLATNNKTDEYIVAAIISMAHSLGMQVIAEGVEQREQMHTLLQMHCDHIQDFYISRPMPARKFEAFIRHIARQSA